MENLLLDIGYTIRYTQDMKTAISINETIFREAEDAAAEMGLSRSGLYTLAVEEYIRNHRSAVITERLNQYYRDHKAVLDDDIKQAAYALFAGEDW
jgi:antitoxin component of RelBE/YafQ-DinJ toxin-antitoxin module